MNNSNNKIWLLTNFKRLLIVFLIYLTHSALYGFVSVNHVNRNYNLLTDLDKIFPFVPEMVYLYMSFYVVLLVSVFFFRTEEAFGKTITSLSGTLLLTYPIFYLFPANYPVPSFDVNSFTTRFLKWCFQEDVRNNTFPSLHVGISFTIAFAMMHYRKKAGIIYLVWATGIAVSTLMIRKHFLIDSFGGIVMATLNYNLFVSGKFADPIIKAIYKFNSYLANLLEKKFTIKHLKWNLAYLIIELLRVK
jgi:membrane-associated phospholipid phosphatase